MHSLLLRGRHRGEAVRRLLLVALPFLLVACSDDAAGTEQPEPVSIPGGATWVDDPFSGGYPTYDDEATGLRVVFGTPDLGLNDGAPSRVTFALFNDTGLISDPALAVAARYYAEGPAGDFEVREEAEFEFHPFPVGSRGIYVGALQFDAAGLWALDVSVPAAGSGDGVAHVVFPVEVGQDAHAPGVGDAAPASVSRTVEDEPDLRALTTGAEPDARLYQTSIQAALQQGDPFVLTFASPAYCTNALCGPQVEVLSELADDHADRATFIHVDLYENPQELRGDFALARRTPVLREWGIHTDEWTFVVDEAGIVTARFEGFATREEVEAALLDALDHPSAALPSAARRAAGGS